MHTISASCSGVRASPSGTFPLKQLRTEPNHPPHIFQATGNCISPKEHEINKMSSAKENDDVSLVAAKKAAKAIDRVISTYETPLVGVMLTPTDESPGFDWNYIGVVGSTVSFHSYSCSQYVFLKHSTDCLV